MKSKLTILCHYLAENNIIDYEVIYHEAVKTMHDVFRVLQAPPSQMIKAVLLKVKQDGIHYLLLGIPADQLVNFSRIATILGISKNKISLASPSKTEEITGYEPGALPPFSLKPQSVPFIIDTSFTQHDYVFCGAGTHFNTLKMKTIELKKLPGFSENKLSD
jgi:prolyl-tRNA editing enzyme YbaK/EbsC (Cys-tRNA(Pro) deacylase)